MHLYTINKIWAAKTGKGFFQGHKDDAITLLNHSTVSLLSFDNYYRLTSSNQENLRVVLNQSCDIQFDEQDNLYYYCLAIPQNNGVDDVDRIKYLFDNLIL